MFFPNYSSWSSFHWWFSSVKVMAWSFSALIHFLTPNTNEISAKTALDYSKIDGDEAAIFVLICRCPLFTEGSILWTKWRVWEIWLPLALSVISLQEIADIYDRMMWKFSNFGYACFSTEKDVDSDVLWTWSYPTITATFRKVILRKCCLKTDKDEIIPFCFGQFDKQWFYICTSEVKNSDALSKVGWFSMT